MLEEGRFEGGIMPPPKAVAAGKTAPLSDEDRRMLVRWVDLGCPIDLAYDAADPGPRGNGWMLDDQRPTLAVASPLAGSGADLSRILVGMHDYGTGLELASFDVTADFAIDGFAPGTNLAERFRETSRGVWELRPRDPAPAIAKGTLTVQVRDREGNLSRVERALARAPSR